VRVTVHFSEGEYLKRKYFHALVLIDGSSMKPLQYSNNFYFSEEVGVEFCTGFAIIDMKYHRLPPGSAVNSAPECHRGR
jgi:hypothetical protein